MRSAALFYAVMTQLGFVAILLGLLVLSAAGGADRSPAWRGARRVPATAVFRADAGRVRVQGGPAAAARVAAAGAPRGAEPGVGVDERGDGEPRRLRHRPDRSAAARAGPALVGLTLLVVGAVSAVYGVLQASVATDLKRLLAYSTTENMGLVLSALGAATLFAAAGRRDAAADRDGRGAAAPGRPRRVQEPRFLAAGSVLAATGLRDLDRLGGLARRMPATTALFGIAALGASGLPPGAGFVSEWLLVQALIHAAPRPRHHGRAGDAAGGRRGRADRPGWAWPRW